MNISIVTDSTADLPQDLVEQYQISVVPNILVIDGQSLVDGADISRQEFYTRLPSMNQMPTTGTASSGVYSQLYEDLFSKGADHILSIHPPTVLSGIANAASAASHQFPGKVTIVDSGQVTLGLGLQILTAAEAIRNNAALDKIKEMLVRTRAHTHVIAMLDTLEYIRRSGRVSWARAHLGNLLRVKPFIELHEGSVRSLGEVRTRQKGINRLHELLDASGPWQRIGVLHTNSEQDAQQFASQLAEKIGYQPIMVNVTTIIGTHVGPNALGFAGIVR